MNDILDKYYIVFISNYEDIDLFKTMSDIYYLSDTDINLLIRMFNYIKGFLHLQYLKIFIKLVQIMININMLIQFINYIN